MKFFVKINIMPQAALLDPQGKTIENNTSKLGIDNVTNIRMGKLITLNIESANIESAKKIVTDLCDKLLVNQITEQFDFEIESC
ncbi:MAG: phosphoribosylformylglycinamidine synthase [Flavobacteriales bacterium]|nr:phosphoribosylformylglycinamidine synthase [Flavobacteriales bacterium]|tara:strand:+ start:18705 stop:18956 length:252 start_codon:yes stop_codon:yes gene_type:complete